MAENVEKQETETNSNKTHSYTYPLWQKAEFKKEKLCCPNCGSAAGFAIQNALIKHAELGNIFSLSDGYFKDERYYTNDVYLDDARIICLNCNHTIDDFLLKFDLEMELTNSVSSDGNHIWEFRN